MQLHRERCHYRLGRHLAQSPAALVVIRFYRSLLQELQDFALDVNDPRLRAGADSESHGKRLQTIPHPARAEKFICLCLPGPPSPPLPPTPSHQLPPSISIHLHPSIHPSIHVRVCLCKVPLPSTSWECVPPQTLKILGQSCKSIPLFATSQLQRCASRALAIGWALLPQKGNLPVVSDGSSLGCKSRLPLRFSALRQWLPRSTARCWPATMQ